MSEPTIYNEIALKIKGQQKEIEKLKKELKLAEENEEYWRNAFSDLEDEYARLKEWKEDLESIRKDAIKFIKKYCIDDEFDINLTHKERAIFEVLNILKGDE